MIFYSFQLRYKLYKILLPIPWSIFRSRSHSYRPYSRCEDCSIRICAIDFQVGNHYRTLIAWNSLIKYISLSGHSWKGRRMPIHHYSSGQSHTKTQLFLLAVPMTSFLLLYASRGNFFLLRVTISFIFLCLFFVYFCWLILYICTVMKNTRSEKLVKFVGWQFQNDTLIIWMNGFDF